MLRYYHHFRHLAAKGIVQHCDHAARLSDSSPVVHQETIYKAIAYHVLNRLLIRQPDAPDVPLLHTVFDYASGICLH